MMMFIICSKSIDDGDDVYETILANDENVDTTNDAMIMMTYMIMIMSTMMKTMIMVVKV